MCKEDKQKIAIIILNYFGFEDTKTCIQSIHQHCVNSTYHYDILLVENSGDERELVKLQGLKGCQVVSTGKNLGFGGGCNYGFKLLQSQGYDYFMLLNNDCEVNADFISPLIDAIHQCQDACVVAPVIYNLDGSVQSAGFNMNTLSGRISPNHIVSHESKISFLSGCCLLLPTQLIGKIGGFDDAFFMYWEDVDFCWRAVASGYQLVVCESSSVYHQDGASTKQDSYLKQYYNNKSQRIFAKKHQMMRAAYMNVLLRFLKSCLLLQRNRVRAIINVWLRDL